MAKAIDTTKVVTTKKRRNELIGEVVSSKMNKTITVQVYNLVRHKKYGKFIRHSTRFKAHDEKNEAKLGDKVKIHETRPLSKTKRWMLVKVLEARKQTEGVDL